MAPVLHAEGALDELGGHGQEPGDHQPQGGAERRLIDIIYLDDHVEVNPETAKAAGFGEGDYAVLKTPLGGATVRVHLSNGLMPGLVAIPRGLGHTAFDGYLAEKGINANDLIGSVEDAASGLDAAWGILASLVKA